MSFSLPCSIICMLVKISTTWIFVSIPYINIQGATAGSLIAYSLICVIGMALLIKFSGVKPDFIGTTVKPLIPANVRTGIKEVTKYSRIFNTAEQAVNNVTTTDDVWIPSCREVGFGVETEGPVYSRAFNGNTARIKYKIGASSASWWWLRSASHDYGFCYVNIGGTSYGLNAYTEGAVALGFCT